MLCHPFHTLITIFIYKLMYTLLVVPPLLFSLDSSDSTTTHRSLSEVFLTGNPPTDLLLLLVWSVSTFRFGRPGSVVLPFSSVRPLPTTKFVLSRHPDGVLVPLPTVPYTTLPHVTSTVPRPP